MDARRAPGAPAPAARAPRLRRRQLDPGRRDRRRAPDGAVLRRLDDRVGEHDRGRARRAVDRLLVRRAHGRPPARPAARCACSCWSPPRCSALVPIVAQPFLSLSVERVRRPLARRRLRLAARRARARRDPGADARRRLAVGDPAEAREHRGLGRDRRAHVRDLDRRLAARHVPLRAAADPAGRHPAHVPRLRARAGDRRRGRAPAPLVARPARHRRAVRGPGRHRQGGRGRQGDPRDRHDVPVRARHRPPQRRPHARAQRGPGDPLALPPRQRAHRRLLGRLSSSRRSPPAPTRRAGSRSSASPAARSPAPTRATSRARSSTASRSTASCSTSATATSASARARSCASTPRTRARSCATPPPATTRSSSTPTASPTSRSTSRPTSSSSSCATGSRPAAR